MATTLEEWREVVVDNIPEGVNREIKYEVSNTGKVRNTKTKRELKSCASGGYPIVGIYSKTYPVHRLVAKAFIPNPDNKEAVNHINKIKTDNNASNLEWATNAENNAHKLLTLEVKTNQFRPVNRINLTTGAILETYPSITEAAEWVLKNSNTTKIISCKSGISACLSGKHKGSFSYNWAYAPQPDLEGEEWRPMVIEGVNTDGYTISNLARIRNARGVIYDNYKPHHTGYITIHLQYKKYPLHRLVALAFISNPDNKPAVNHKDGNKVNNRADNLEWVTIAENNTHCRKNGIVNIFKRKVIQYDLNMNELARFDSIKEAAQALGIREGNIKSVLSNEQHKSKGFIFRYADENVQRASTTASVV
jgi:hypothetical protein